MRRLFVFVMWLIVALAALVIVVGFFAAIGTVDRSDLPEVDVSAEAADSALRLATAATRYPAASSAMASEAPSRPAPMMPIDFGRASMSQLCHSHPPQTGLCTTSRPSRTLLRMLTRPPSALALANRRPRL